MSRQPLHIIDRGQTFVVRGNALKILEAGGFRGIWTGVSKGWVLDRHRLGDVCAYLDSRHIAYQIHRGDT
jgi:hypothetical protein